MILTNNIKAIETVNNLTANEIGKRVKDFGLLEYGSGHVSIYEKWRQYAGAETVVGTFDNADTDFVLCGIAEKNPAGVIAGLAAAVKVIGAEHAALILPDSSNNETLYDYAKKAGIALAIETGTMTDVRVHKNDLLIHIETLAAVGDVLTGESFGTVVSVNHDNPIEILFGTKLGDLIDSEKVKAVFMNHRFYKPIVLETPLTPDFALGSGVIATIEDTDCMVDSALKALHSLRKKSCGKCTFCREGLYQLETIFTDITQGRAKDADMGLSAELGGAMTFSTLCTLGKNASEPVLSVLGNFREEINSHIKKKVCPSGVCSAFTSIYIDPTQCRGCGECIDVCPENCIEGKDGFISMIDEFDCTKCGKCLEACPNGAAQRASGRPPKLPERLTRVGRFRRR